MSTKSTPNNVRFETLINTIAMLVHSLTDAYATVADLNYQVSNYKENAVSHERERIALKADLRGIQRAYDDHLLKHSGCLTIEVEDRRKMYAALFSVWGNEFTFRTTYHSGPNPSKISAIKEFRQVLNDRGLNVSLLDAKVCVETMFAEWDTWQKDDPWANTPSAYDEPPF